MKANEKKLLNLYRDMLETDQHALLRYAEFLSERQEKITVEIAKPVLISPKENESVVGALKRLSAAYPMLDKTKMLDQTSGLMSEHLLRGRPKEEVIREFEHLFDLQYQKLIRENRTHD